MQVLFKPVDARLVAAAAPQPEHKSPASVRLRAWRTAASQHKERKQACNCHPTPVTAAHAPCCCCAQMQSFDQTFDNMNAALKVSCLRGLPVRVVRSFKEKRSSYAPSIETPVRYDGIYRILRCWRKKGAQGFLMCRWDVQLGVCYRLHVSKQTGGVVRNLWGSCWVCSRSPYL